MEDLPFISIVIVTWNNKDDIRSCLESVFKIAYKNFNVIVVDNASSDNTPLIIKQEFPKAILIQNEKNVFLTGGNNAGIHLAIKNYSAQFVMVLNPDTVVQNNLLKVLLETCNSDDKVGAVAPKVIFAKGENKGKINSTGLVYDGFMQAYDRGIFEEDKGQYDALEEVKAVSGTCILYRTQALKEVGLYYEPIKMYLDDLEISIRLRKKNWKIIYNPYTEILHSYMASTVANKNFDREKQKMEAWLLIALRHDSIKAKLAMLRKYVSFTYFSSNTTI
jgi:GT2 family glycosyltransferase